MIDQDRNNTLRSTGDAPVSATSRREPGQAEGRAGADKPSADDLQRLVVLHLGQGTQRRTPRWLLRIFSALLAGLVLFLLLFFLFR